MTAFLSDGTETRVGAASELMFHLRPASTLLYEASAITQKGSL